MNRTISFVLASALIFGVFLPTEAAVAQTANQLVGTWTLVSITLEKDGKTTDFYGPNPMGRIIFAHFSRHSMPGWTLHDNVFVDRALR